MSFCCKKSERTERGFSLIEIAIALAIIGLLLIPFVQQYNIDAEAKKISRTRANLGVSEAALHKFALKYGRYPRPANPSLGPQSAIPPNPNKPFGVEEGLLAYPTCTSASAVVCQTPGMRDVSPANGVNDPVYIGSIPFATLGIPQEASLDAFGNKLTYAISATLTNAATFNDAAGVLRLENNLGAPLEAHTDNVVHFTIVSHGEDAKGAFTLNGIRTVPCGPSGTARDNRNCDNNAIFDDGTLSGAAIKVVSKSVGNNNEYWNDIYTYSSSTASDIWNPIANSDDMIRAGANIETIRINTSASDSLVRVEVNGNARTDKISTPNICLKSKTPVDKCISPTTIGMAAPAAPAPGGPSQPGIRCPVDTAMTAVWNGNEECGPLKASNPSAIIFPGCPAGKFPVGIDATGKVTCATP